MKKIGIITLNGNFNYGNRLQNYALQKVIEKEGAQVDTILVDKYKKNNDGISILIKRKIKKLLQNVQLYTPSYKYERMRLNKFIFFSKKFIKETNFYISDNNFQESKIKEYDYFVTGSDQVWNPAFNNGVSSYFLTFAPLEKRISYAASFGVSEIPPKYQANYKEWLGNISSLSVREQAGVEIINQLTGRKDVEVVLDPTLLLNSEDWLDIASPHKHKPSSKYLLTYFLGDVSEETEKEIKSIAAHYSLEIIHLANKKDIHAYTADPSEFLDYINSSEVFLTDSFHGSVFSILFRKNFVVFDRQSKGQSMNSRIDTLLNTFNLLDRKWKNIKNYESILNIDYTNINIILNEEREKSLAFLRNSMK
ncbi:polysaccharide pyruvyl transferase family protein [Gracilibacillus alcaliphilus]|uniref:polysaccharide pyruvyl transferase family protein n=1 Tax=Gracilibacillus alcaliphilus TaxID=1401441 RepID=UPI00195B5F42|nr:polysaccharide pyruvyl transferase family protein [Gracilibacillus alcaliphilus]MBM7678454.1 hypothetical protein [Gracilibacillus alcaliphilus]